MSVVAPTLPSKQPPAGKASVRTTAPRSEWLLPITVAGFFVAFLPVLMAYLPQLWIREYYRFFPFAFGVTLLLAFSRAATKPKFEGSATRWTFRSIAFLIAEASLVSGIALGSPLSCFVACVVVLGLILDFWNESNCNRSLAYLLLPLMLIVRPPLNLDESAIHSLQRITSKLASSFLSAVHVDHILSGNIIQPLVGPALLVEEACSGVQSLFTLMFIAAFLGVSRRYPLARTLLLVGSAVFWALIMNVFRVIAIALAQTQLQLDVTSGWKHEAVGYAGILLAVAFLFSTDRLLLFFFGGIPDDPMKNASVNVFVSFWNWLFVTPETDIAEPAKIGAKSDRSSRAVASSSNQPTASRTPLIAASVMAIIVVLTAIPAWSLPGLPRFFKSASQPTSSDNVINDVPADSPDEGSQP